MNRNVKQKRERHDNDVTVDIKDADTGNTSARTHTRARTRVHAHALEDTSNNATLYTATDVLGTFFRENEKKERNYNKRII